MAGLAKDAERIESLEAENIYLKVELEHERIKRVGWMNKALAERAKVQRYRVSCRRLVATLRDGHEDFQLKCHKGAAWLEGLIQEDEANKAHQIGGEQDVAA